MSMTPRPGLSRLAAYGAAPLWAAQALIWTTAPKVQEPSAPHAITNVLLFELVWLSVAGAVALSAIAALAIPAHGGIATPRLARTGSALLHITGWSTAVATLSIAAAPLPAAPPVLLAIMSVSLYGAALTLTAGLVLLATASRTARSVPVTTARATSALAFGTGLTLAAIVASGTSSIAGLYIAEAIVLLDATAWFRWGLVLTKARPAPYAATADHPAYEGPGGSQVRTPGRPTKTATRGRHWPATVDDR